MILEKSCGYRRTLLAAVAMVLFWALPVEAVEFLDIGDVKIGMQGKGKTVIYGTRIDEFDVEVLGILKNEGPSGDLILVRASGPLIDLTGGIIEGMSGSPVYIGDKLLGAIAYGLTGTDHKTGMVTPIGQMLDLLRYPPPVPKNIVISAAGSDTGKGDAQPDGAGDGPAGIQGADRLAAADGEQGDGEATAGGQTDQVWSDDDGGNDGQPKGVLYASGFGRHGLELLKRHMRDYDIHDNVAAGLPADISFPPLQPGSAVGAELARGDFSLGAIGTVTYVDGDNVLAFGHPFLRNGNSGYFLTNAYIFTPVQGIKSGFKVGVAADVVGSVIQDRGAGILGKLGSRANIVPIEIEVIDTDRHQRRVARLQTVDDEQISPTLAAAALADTIDRAIDREGVGTSRVKFSLRADGLPGGKIERENMFFDPDSVTDVSTDEMFDILTVLNTNMFNPIDINMLEISAEVTAEPKIASIVEARMVQPVAKPGDKVQVEVELQPYRGANFRRQVDVQIPPNQPPGEVVLEVRGGGMLPLIEVLAGMMAAESDKIKVERKEKKFSDLVKKIEQLPHNNDIVVEFLPIDPGEFSRGAGESGRPAGEKESGPLPKTSIRPLADDERKEVLPAENRRTASGRQPQPLRGVLTTEYIIDDHTQVFLKIAG
ncbi:MAG: hypothetical protein N3A57_02020 [Negativicutes bacterium]|nr:hypothetical protein [Negativicutes bacterium]